MGQGWAAAGDALPCRLLSPGTAFSTGLRNRIVTGGMSITSRCTARSGRPPAAPRGPVRASRRRPLSVCGANGRAQRRCRARWCRLGRIASAELAAARPYARAHGQNPAQNAARQTHASPIQRLAGRARRVHGGQPSAPLRPAEAGWAERITRLWPLSASGSNGSSDAPTASLVCTGRAQPRRRPALLSRPGFRSLVSGSGPFSANLPTDSDPHRWIALYARCVCLPCQSPEQRGRYGTLSLPPRFARYCATEAGANNANPRAYSSSATSAATPCDAQTCCTVPGRRLGASASTASTGPKGAVAVAPSPPGGQSTQARNACRCSSSKNTRSRPGYPP